MVRENLRILRDYEQKIFLANIEIIIDTVSGMCNIVDVATNTQESRMAPLGKTKHNALSPKWTKSLRKAGKAKARQQAKREMKDA